MKSIALPYWGQIISIVSNQKSRSLFITRQQTPVLYILDHTSEQCRLESLTLPCRMQHLINDKSDSDKVILLGADGHLYQTDWYAKKVHKISKVSLFNRITALDNTCDSSQDINVSIDPVAIAQLSATSIADADSTNSDAATLALLYPQHLVIWQYQSTQAATADLSILIEPLYDSVHTLANHTQNDTQNSTQHATTMATSSDGNWLVIGDRLGFVSSYQRATTPIPSISPNTVPNTSPSIGFGLNLSSRQQLHQGAITALHFEPVSQYFFSAGADKKLYRTQVQGDLYPVDRAKASQHSEMITAMCVSDTRLFTASDDKSIKSWAFDKGAPNSCKEDLTQTRLLLTVSSHAEHCALIAVGCDQSLRIIPIETINSHTPNPAQSHSQNPAQNQRLLPVTDIIKDGYHRLSELLTDTSNNSDIAFTEGLALLEQAHDPKILQNILDIVNQLLTAKNSPITAHQALQLVAWVATTTLDKTVTVLEQLLHSTISVNVRLAAFAALALQANPSARPLPYLEQALSSRYEEIVAAAIQGYLQVGLNDASSQRRIIAILQQTLAHKLPLIRRQALSALETLLPSASPKADLLALDTRYPDIIQAGLIRLYQRDMLASIEVLRHLMLLKNHNNAHVRQTAFYISVLSQPELASALKSTAREQGDTQLLRVLTDFDDFRLLRGTDLNSSTHPTDSARHTTNNTADDAQPIHLALSTQDFMSQADNRAQTKATPKTGHAKTKMKAKTSASDHFSARPDVSPRLSPYLITHLSNDALEPLLQSLANPHEDISFRAAYALACLQDARAFGSLIRLMHADDAVIRAGVATALGALALEEGKTVLPVLLDDKEAGVRLVAMRAFGKLADSALTWAAVGFGSGYQDIHEQSAAIFLAQVVAAEDKDTANTTPEAVQMPAKMTALLKHALNNPFTSIRLEVVKVFLNRERRSASQTDLTTTVELLQQSLFEDVHQGAIEEWQRRLLTLPSKNTASARGHHHAVLALFFRDTFAAIRQQAFDSALKHTKQVNFNEIITTALASPYADIKKRALTTVQTHASSQQLKSLLPALVGMLADDSLNLREHALDVALALTELQPISLALSDAATADIAVDKTGAASQVAHSNEALISAALASPYPDIQLKVAQLLASHSRQCIAESQIVRAEHDKRAYAVFAHYLNQAIPTADKNSEDYKQWHQHVTQALRGLALLSAPSTYDALGWYAKYLHHPDAHFQDLAPNLMWLIAKENPTEACETLAQWQQDERALISQSASLALAVWGDTRGQHFFTHTSKNESHSLNHLVEPLTAIHWLQAKQGLGITHARQLRQAFDSHSLATAARLLLLFNDIQQSLFDSQKPPQRLIEALSFVDNETAMVYANVLARYPAHDSIPSPKGVDGNIDSDERFEACFDSVWHYISDYLTRKVSTVLSAHSAVLDSLAHSRHSTVTSRSITSTSKPIPKTDTIRTAILASVSMSILRQLATSLSPHHPLRQAKAISVLGHLSQLLSHNSDDEEHDVLTTLQAWQRSLQALLHVELSTEISTRSSGIVNIDTDLHPKRPYQALAFGAWLGVIQRHDDNDTHTTNQAIRGLLWLSCQPKNQDKNSTRTPNLDWADSVSRALLPLLNHKESDTRKLTWDNLCQLNTSPKKMSEYAMSSRYPDRVKQGLQLLITSTEDSENLSTHSLSDDITSPINQQLIALLKTNNQPLAEETYILLKQRLGILPASLAALESDCATLPHQVVSEWQQVSITHFPQAHNSQLAPYQTASASAQRLRQNKRDFLLTAIHHNEHSVRLNALAQLLDFHELLLIDETIVNALFTLWSDAHSQYEQSRALDLIRHLLQLSWQRHLNSKDSTSTANTSTDNHNDMADKVTHRTYSRLLALLESKQLKMSAEHIYRTIATLRHTQLVSPLLQRLQQSFERDSNKYERQHIFDTLVMISGYDQPIEDYFDKRVDKRWQHRQHPRHPQVLLSLFSALMSYGDYGRAKQLLPSLAWVQTTKIATTDIAAKEPLSSIDAEIDAQLALAYEQLPAPYTAKLVQTLVFRAEHRHARLSTLQKALVHKDTEVQFLAAEGLAKCGQAQGLTILMATIDYNTEGDVRRRSVLAIGELMGHRQGNLNHHTTTTNPAEMSRLYKAYDKLITLAEDSAHYLQDVASEALGRLAQGDEFEYSPHIFELLKSRLSDSSVEAYNPAVTYWLNGLRWLNTLGAWEQIRLYIRRYLSDTVFYEPQIHAITLLSFNNNDANKALLLELLQHTSGRAASDAAYLTAQKVWGNEADTVYPYDWAVLQNPDESFLEDVDYWSLKRIVLHASIEELTTFISQHAERLPTDTLNSLQNAIMTRTDMSKSQLLTLINGGDYSGDYGGDDNNYNNNARAKGIALSYLAHYPNAYLDNDLFAMLQQQWDSAKGDWQTLIDMMTHHPLKISDNHWLTRVTQVATTIKQLLWLMCRYLPVHQDQMSLNQGHLTQIIEAIRWLDTLLETREETRDTPVITTILPLSGLISDYWQQSLLALLARPIHEDYLLADLLPTVSTLATTQPQRLTHANQTLLTSLVARLQQNHKSSKNTNNQADISQNDLSINQQLLLWITAKDAAALHHCACQEVDISVRVRAIEALGQLHEPQIGQWLAALMQDKEEDIQKLAYKVLRRWQRGIQRTIHRHTAQAIKA